MELKSIDRTDRGKARLNAALSIYRETILPEAQNPERQILYWIDHSQDDLTDEFKCFSITNKGEVIGYLQYSYFREEHIFFLEYLCIKDRSNTGMAPSDAAKLIEEYLSENYRPDFSIVFEVAQKRGENSDWAPDSKLIKYFQRLGFRKIDFDYRYPILQSYDGASSYPADLMARMPGGRVIVSAFEMRTILRCLYFKHYLRWDRPFLDPVRFGERERLIDELYSRQVSTIGPNDKFDTKGDDKRIRAFLLRGEPKIRELVGKIFGPKLPRILFSLAVTIIVYKITDSVVGLISIVLSASALYCLAEDTTNSQKLFIAIISRLQFSRQRP